MNRLATDPGYHRLKNQVIHSTGLAFYADRDSQLTELIDARLSHLRLLDCSAYARLLAGAEGGAEMDLLIGQLTIGETYFFRDEQQFAAIRDVILPEILERKRDRKVLRIWSAGCATGAEPYSLAILLADGMRGRLAGWNIGIYASDFNRTYLRQAAEGKFRAWALRNTSDKVKRECFLKEGQVWTVQPRYRQWISFHYINLAGEQFSTPLNAGAQFDVILCRNVMIYFAREVNRRLIANFHESLGDGGWLVVGGTEYNLRNYAAFRTVEASGARLYQKRVVEETGREAPAKDLSAGPLAPQLSAKPVNNGSIKTRTKSARPFSAVTKEPARKVPGQSVSPAIPRTRSDRLDTEGLRQLANSGDWKAAAEYGRVLLAQDQLVPEIHFYRALSQEMRNQGYKVQSAPSGPDGLKELQSQSFDCVLVDLVMPYMTGIEVCRRITAMRSTLENVPAVILLTGSTNKEDMNRGLEAGADDFVTKSSDLAVLRARIQALLRRRFFQEETRRIVEELKTKELETRSAMAGRQAAEARAALAEKLVQANHDLEEANRKLKETQAQLIQNEKMASLGQLVAGIAHEINNPLAFVLNNLFIVESGLDGLRPEIEPHLAEPALKKLRQARARLEEMRAGLARVKELVLDLRTFSRLDEGEFKTVDVVETIDAVLLLLKHKMNSRIHVERHYGPERMLYCYAGRVNQVLMNLIANAVDAIAGEGKIVITTAQTSEVFTISVRDTGAGIPEAIRSKIFDPFFTTKPVGQGTGLGLAISYGIIQEHGGSIEVQSEVGAGTEFMVKIPLDLESQGKK